MVKARLTQEKSKENPANESIVLSSIQQCNYFLFPLPACYGPLKNNYA